MSLDYSCASVIEAYFNILPFALGLFHVTRINKYSRRVLQNSFAAINANIEQTHVCSLSSTERKSTVYFWSSVPNERLISKSSVYCLHCEVMGSFPLGYLLNLVIMFTGI